MHSGTNGVETMAKLRGSVEAVNDRIKIQNNSSTRNRRLGGPFNGVALKS